MNEVYSYHQFTNNMTNRYPHLHQTEEKWFAVRTRYKSEKRVRDMLQNKNVTAYAPTHKQARKRSGKLKMVELPLISCYVFVKITRPQYVQVLETEHITGFVKMGNQLMPIPEESINVLRKISLEENLEITSNQKTFEKGDIVEICKGSMIGVKGHIVSQDNKHLFKIQLEETEFDLLITVDAAFLEKTGLSIEPKNEPNSKIRTTWT